METLGGFPNLPAMVRAEQSSAAPHAFASPADRRGLRVYSPAGAGSYGVAVGGKGMPSKNLATVVLLTSVGFLGCFRDQTSFFSLVI